MSVLRATSRSWSIPSARALVGPVHTHRYEDEYTYVLEGEVGVQVGERS